MQVPQITKDCLLKLLDKVVAICDEYGLCYYLAGGSVLGAIRHKGFIPWDDDIDIYLLRDDYEKLLNLPSDVWGEDFRLAYFTNTTNYTYDFIKIELTNTTVIERIHPDYHGRVFLDVFPLDFVSNNLHKRESDYDKIQSIKNDYVNIYLKNDCDCQSIWELFYLKWLRFRYRNNSLLYKFDALTKIEKKSDCDMVMSYHGTWKKEPLPFIFFAEGEFAYFEGKKYRIPKMWDSYLKYRYGDYMKLPSLEKRIAHNFDFANYEKRISDEDTDILFKEIHNKYKYRFSLKNELKFIFRKIKKK